MREKKLAYRRETRTTSLRSDRHPAKRSYLLAEHDADVGARPRDDMADEGVSEVAHLLALEAVREVDAHGPRDQVILVGVETVMGRRREDADVIVGH